MTETRSVPSTSDGGHQGGIARSIGQAQCAKDIPGGHPARRELSLQFSLVDTDVSTIAHERTAPLGPMDSVPVWT